MIDGRNLKKEVEELNILSIEGSGLLTEKAIFSAFDAIKDSNSRRDEAAEWRHIKELQDKKARRMEGANIG
jgi:cation transport regulator ChaB